MSILLRTEAKLSWQFSSRGSNPACMRQLKQRPLANRETPPHAAHFTGSCTRFASESVSPGRFIGTIRPRPALDKGIVSPHRYLRDVQPCGRPHRATDRGDAAAFDKVIASRLPPACQVVAPGSGTKHRRAPP